MRTSGKHAATAKRNSPSLLVVGRLLATALALISAPIVARAIGPEGRGETAAAIALFYIVPIVLALGVPLEVRRIAATTDGKSALRSARLYCAASFLLSSAIGLILFFTLFLEFSSTARYVATLGIILSPLTMSWMCDNSVLVAHRQYRGVFLLQVSSPALYVVLVCGIWISGTATTGLVLLAHITGNIATFVIALFLTKTSVRGSCHRFRPLMAGSIRFAGSSIAEAASSRADQILILPLAGAFQAGIYSVAATVSAVPIAFGQALGAAYFPTVAQTPIQDRGSVRAEAVRSALSIMIMCVPIVLVGAAIGIPIVFGNEFAPAIAVTWISIPAAGVLLVAYVTSMVLAAEGRGLVMTTAQFGSLAIGIASLLLLAPTYGATGAAAATGISNVVLLGWLLYASRVSFGRIIPRPRDFLRSLQVLRRSS